MAERQLDNFYCSEKFTWLSVDLEKRQTFSCCAARPQQINMNWVKQNPGQLFNTPSLQNERQQMLNNMPVASCEDVCWKLERNDVLSRRQMLKSDVITHTNIQTTTPEKLNIVLGSTCNLTCSYCCKNYSSAWRRDIVEHGAYLDHERFNLTAMDQILSKISHKEHQDSNAFQTLATELETFSNVTEIYISGGEPFLYNTLPDLLNKLSERGSRIVCFTGMGIDSKRFSTQLQKIINKDNLDIAVSAETCNGLYEFNRYGNSWQNFLDNLDALKNQGFNYHFSSVFSNLTIFGLIDFVKTFPDKIIRYQFCGVPDFLNVNVLDDTSKRLLVRDLKASDIPFREDICEVISRPCTEQQRKELSSYLIEFARRRNLSLDVYPSHFTSWIFNAI
jgi:organic radical activating enzyme